MCSSAKPSPDAFMVNLRLEMPIARKIKLVLRNSGTKIVTLRNCCGHPGEPGC